VCGLTIALSGCASEVDKCVDALEKEYGETEMANARLAFLNAQAGKQCAS
jgi:hypothetical protein